MNIAMNNESSTVLRLCPAFGNRLVAITGNTGYTKTEIEVPGNWWEVEAVSGTDGQW